MLIPDFIYAKIYHGTDLTIEEAVLTIRSYIMERKGAVIGKIIINNIELFNQAVTIACSYYKGIGGPPPQTIQFI